MAGHKFQPGHERLGGRVKGQRNKETIELQEIASLYTVEAVNKLVALMRNGKTEEIQRLAAVGLLERSHGKPFQQQVHVGDAAKPIEFVHSFKTRI